MWYPGNWMPSEPGTTVCPNGLPISAVVSVWPDPAKRPGVDRKNGREGWFCRTSEDIPKRTVALAQGQLPGVMDAPEHLRV